MTTEYRRLCQRLTELRLAAGLSQREVATRLGSSQGFVTKYERADRRLDLIQLRDVCHVLGASLTDLVAEFDTLDIE